MHSPRGASAAADVLVLVHGGFWRWPYGRWATWLISRDAVSHGHTVLNLGYRRLGRFGGGGGWPNTFDDVGDAIGLIAEQRPDSKVVVIGHSAGGHLALVAAARHPEAITGVVAIAAPTDLRALAENGSIPVAELVEGTRTEDRWALTSPIEMLPTGVRTVCVHSDADRTVSPSMSERYVEAALLAGDDSRLVRVVGDVHSDALRPGRSTWIRALSAAEHWLANDSESVEVGDERVGGRNV